MGPWSRHYSMTSMLAFKLCALENDSFSWEKPQWKRTLKKKKKNVKKTQNDTLPLWATGLSMKGRGWGCKAAQMVTKALSSWLCI